MRPWLIPPRGPLGFPDPNDFDDSGLLALGGDLSPERLLAAYDAGIFPWSDDDLPLWWSPDPRAVLERADLHVSRSLKRELKKPHWSVTANQDFERIIALCGERSEGTWIHPSMRIAYGALHHAGHAHSIEVWSEGELVGGLYGVQRGALFAAESMFHRRTNASKIALVAAVTLLFDAGVSLFDVQFVTDHLESMGVSEIPRADYLNRLAVARQQSVPLGEILRGPLLPKVLRLLNQ